MCGIFGIISASRKSINKEHLEVLVYAAEERGRDSSGLAFLVKDQYKIHKADYNIEKLLAKARPWESRTVMGHSRLVTNGTKDNQPVLRDNVCVIHNGIIVNDDVWEKTGLERKYEIDTEIIAAIAEDVLKKGDELECIESRVKEVCEGVVACAILLPTLGKILLFSNNGSLYIGENEHGTYFASESHPLTKLDCHTIDKVKDLRVIDVESSEKNFEVINESFRKIDLVPELRRCSEEEALLVYPKPNFKRCTKCILPETMPFIHFDNEGVCNYCKNYKKRNIPRPKEELFKLVEPYRRNGDDCIVPFSGGRDSCYALHLIVKELKMKPITYTYDWGMVTGLGRRNISRMSAALGVENIIVAADISKKRKNIKMNLEAWLKSPHLGMISVLTAGDKHFFKYVETVKRQTGINLNLWGINPLEVTHFKTGFLGIEPDFESNKVYTHGALKQLRYQYHRFKAMSKSPGYFNSSLYDTLSGEYYRSFTEKSDYYHIFDYWRWDEETINNTLDEYDWERAPDTSTTWRIGDGTAAFYNYVYYTVAGFTEHDTFRSNQIREGEMTREEALRLCEDENQPRYSNIRWYLDILGLDFKETIKIVNAIPRLYEQELQSEGIYQPS